MKKILTFIGFYLALTTAVVGQTLESAATFLGYELGERFTFHHRVVDYFEYVAANSDKVELQHYGKTTEGRPLVVAFISSPSNLKKLEQYRQNNLIKTGLLKGEPKGKQLPIVWLSYNIHGDEAAGTEAALATLEAFAMDEQYENWLDEVIVVIDPCENPDGRDRYAMWVNQTMGNPPNTNLDAYEHHQHWPGGRFNHYLFDLNRDWAWQTQVESQARTQLYHQWMPQVHVDLHEMGHQESYFFAPAAKPMHEAITEWQREFQVHIGNNHARYFDKQGWFYFTKEVYDLLYPSYGDTWPIFNGAIGFTYEQGGSGRASVGVLLEEGRVLTLKDRLEHHKTTSISTVETAFNFRKKLLDEFNNYFKEAVENPRGQYKSFVVKGTNHPSKKQALLKLLNNQLIEVGTAETTGNSVIGFNYFTQKQETFTLEKGDLIISLKQPQSNLVKVLFEPKTRLEDSLTYDLTAWALPYVFNLQTYAVTSFLPNKMIENLGTPETEAIQEEPYAFLATWKDGQDGVFLGAALQKGLKVRFSQGPFSIGEKTYEQGTIMIAKADNKVLNEDWVDVVRSIQKELGYPNLTSVVSGMVTSGSDLGASNMEYIKPPRVAILGGSGISPTSFGEYWHYFEQVLKYPVTVLNTNYFDEVNLNNYDVILLAEGYYSSLQISNTLITFVRNGGKLILVGNALQIMARERETQLGKAYDNFSVGGAEEVTDLKTYSNRERASLSNSVAGSIYRVYLDPTHPLAFGFDESMYIIKQNRYVYSFLQGSAWNVGMFKNDSYVAGFVGANLKPKIPQTMAFGVERLGRGNIVYLCDSPIFRGFWHSGTLLLNNALFFVGQ